MQPKWFDQQIERLVAAGVARRYTEKEMRPIIKKLAAEILAEQDRRMMALVQAALDTHP